MTIQIQIESTGDQYTQFTSAFVDLRLDALSNSFDFEVASTDRKPLPFLGGETCKVIVDGEQVLEGQIEIVDRDYDATSDTIILKGRDKTGRVVDSSLDSSSDLSPPITLKQIIENALENIGEDDIEVVDEASPEPFNKAEDLISPDPGQNAFEYLERYARKRNVILSSDSSGNIVISKSRPELIDSPIRNIFDGRSNNVIRGKISIDTTGRFRNYKFVSSLNPIAANFAGFITNDQITDQSGSVIDADIIQGRTLVLVAEEAMSDEQNEKRAQWEANVRKARGRIYSVVVDGFRGQNGELWKPNTLVSVVDDMAGIDARMLINNVNFSYGPDGSLTTLGLLNENAYTLTLEEPKTEKIGSGIFV